MAGWYGARRLNMSGKAVIAVAVIAVVLVAAVPVALVAGIIMMLLGHVIGGLALFGGSVLAATGAVLLAGLSGARHLRKMVTGPSFRIVTLGRDDYSYRSDDHSYRGDAYGYRGNDHSYLN
jgi:uncharacterized membrane protein YdjX (TVP38/TMEM64 family)